MVQKRDIVVAIVLTVVTCGIYGLYWFIVMTDDVKAASGDASFTSGGMSLLLTILTCGIYGIYWAYKMGELMKVAQESNGLPVKDNSILYLILEIIGLSIVVYILVQSDLNAIADKNNGAA